MKRVLLVGLLVAVAVLGSSLAGTGAALSERVLMTGQANIGGVRVKARLLHRDGEDYYILRALITNLSGMTIQLHYQCSSLLTVVEIKQEEVPCPEGLHPALLASGASLEDDFGFAQARLPEVRPLTARLVYRADHGEQVVEVPLRPSGRLPLGWMLVGVSVAAVVALTMRYQRRA